MNINAQLTLPCGAIIKNRLAKAAMTEGIADAANRATARHQTLYERWAKGGTGLLITGNIMVDRRYLERPGNVAIDGPQTSEQISALAAWAGLAKAHDTHIWPQLSHAGRQSPKSVAIEPAGPSSVEVELPGGQFGKPRALTAEEIEDVITRFSDASAIVKEAGFTGVQIHGAHGYLISEFLNPRVNLRTDDWGGSLENRARLLLTIVKEVRTRVGADFPVSVKLNSSDFQKGGFDFSDCLQVVQWLEALGIDLLEISGGSYEQPKMMGLEGMEPVFEEGIGASTKKREAYFLAYAEKIAASVKTPLMVSGGFRSVDAMNEALENGAADMIGIARPLCVDPDMSHQLLRGAVQVAPSWEKELALGPGIFGASSSIDFLKMLNGFGTMAFFYKNLFRLADGLEAKRKMFLLPAFISHQMHEARAAKSLLDR